MHLHVLSCNALTPICHAGDKKADDKEEKEIKGIYMLLILSAEYCSHRLL